MNRMHTLPYTARNDTAKVNTLAYELLFGETFVGC